MHLLRIRAIVKKCQIAFKKPRTQPMCNTYHSCCVSLVYLNLEQILAFFYDTDIFEAGSPIFLNLFLPAPIFTVSSFYYLKNNNPSSLDLHWLCSPSRFTDKLLKKKAKHHFISFLRSPLIY